MKYVLIIPDGAADMPLDELGGKTPLDAANTPGLDRLASIGRLGTVATTPKGKPCGSDVCSMSLLGYDPTVYHDGRAPLEAAALGIDLDPADWVFRLNLVTIIDGVMQDHSAGHISSAEGERLLAEFTATALPPAFAGVTLYPGVSYRNLMVDPSQRGEIAADGGGRDWGEVVTVPPHDIPGEAIRKHLPVGGDMAGSLRELIDASAAFLDGHEINLTRREMGEAEATHFWPWGQGRRVPMPGFAGRFGVEGAMITAVDLLAGIAAFIGWDRLDVPGQTSYHDNNYAATGAHAIAALDGYDLVCVHVESPDEASHAGDAATKVAAIEAIDRGVVTPLHEALEGRGEPWRVLVLPDHYTRVATRKHDPTPVPCLLAGAGLTSRREHRFTEADAAASDLHIRHGHELMEFFLRSGVG